MSRKLMQNERKVISAADKEGRAAQGVSDPVRQPRGGRVGGHLSGHQVRSHSIAGGWVAIQLILENIQEARTRPKYVRDI